MSFGKKKLLALVGAAFTVIVAISMLSGSAGAGVFTVECTCTDGCPNTPTLAEVTKITNLDDKKVDIAIVNDDPADQATVVGKAILQKLVIGGTLNELAPVNTLKQAIDEIDQAYIANSNVPVNVIIMDHAAPGNPDANAIGNANQKQIDNQKMFVNALTGKIEHLKFLSCSVAQGPPGQAFLEKLTKGLGADLVEGFTAPVWPSASHNNFYVSNTGAKKSVTPEPVDTSSVTCADVYLVELQASVATNPKPVAAGDPPLASLGLNIPVAISVTYSQHDLTDNTTHGVGSTYNGGISGVIAGTLPFPITQRCATIDKEVASVDVGAPNNPGNGQFMMDVTNEQANPPMVGMIVYWDSNKATQAGFYYVDKTGGGSITLTALIDGACNGSGTNPAAPGVLKSCIPTNKGLEVVADAACAPLGGCPQQVAYPLAYSNSNIVDTAAISTFGKTGGVPRTDANQCPILIPDPGSPESGSCYDKVAGQSESSACGGSTGFQEGEQQNAWTRTDIITVTKAVNSEKVPSYGIAQLYNPTSPKNCANTTSTNRSTNITVVWSLDGGPDTGTYDSDWDKDGCLDWQEHSSPLPVYAAGNGPPIVNVDAAVAGRDALNPNDCDRNLDGIWSATITIDAVSLTTGNNRVAGLYYGCRLHVTHNNKNTGNDLDAKIICYTDDPNVDVNPENDPGVKGDGFTGSPFPIGSAAPPKPYADVPTVGIATHAALSGSFSKANDTWSLEGCIENVAGLQGPNMYIRFTDIGGRTGNGTVEIWRNRLTCAKPGGAGELAGKANLVHLAGKSDGDRFTRFDAGNYDFDLDGCPDSRELLDNKNLGGMRDPSNPYDRQDQNKDGFVTIPDILETASHFGPVPVALQPGPWDRSPSMIGANAWNREEQDNVVSIPDDILGTAGQFGHGCF